MLNFAKIITLSILYLAAADMTIVSSILPMLTKQFSGGINLYPWLMSGFILSSIISASLTGFYSDRYGFKRLTLIGLIVFLLGNLLCCASLNIETLIFGRCLQGLGSGMLIVMVYISLVKISSSKADRNKAQGYVSLVWGCAVLSGPFVGTMLFHMIGWRSIFFVLTIMATLILIFFYFFVKVHDQHDISSSQSNFLTTTLFSLFLAGLVSLAMVFTINFVQQHMVIVIFFTILSLAGYIYFSISKPKTDIIPREIFNSKKLGVCFFATLGASMILYSTIILFPFLFHYLFPRHYSYTSFLIFSGAMGWVASAFFISGIRKCSDVKRKKIMLIASSAIFIGVISIYFNLQYINIIVFILSEFLIGIGIGSIATLTMIVFQDASEVSTVSRFTAASQLSRNIGAAVGMNLIVSMQQYFSNFYRQYLKGFEMSIFVLIMIASIVLILSIYYPNSMSYEGEAICTK